MEVEAVVELAAPDDYPLALAVDAELFRLDGVIRWLDTADGRLRRVATDSESESDSVSAPAAPLPKLLRRVGVRR